MKAQDNVRKDKKKRWEAPRIDIISGLDSCVEFLYIPFPTEQQQQQQ